MLKLAGEGIVAEQIEKLEYHPAVQDSGDLETATRTVSDTAKPGTPDYTTSLTVPAPGDARLEVLRLALRLAVTIDSFGGDPAATQVSYSVEVNGVERLTGSWNTTGAQAAAVDLTEGQFDLGSANDVRIYLWVDQGNAVVSLCQVWLGVGSSSVSDILVLALKHVGLVWIGSRVNRVGTGTPHLCWYQTTGVNLGGNRIVEASGHAVWANQLALVSTCYAALSGAVASDINCMVEGHFIVRSER